MFRDTESHIFGANVCSTRDLILELDKRNCDGYCSAMIVVATLRMLGAFAAAGRKCTV